MPPGIPSGRRRFRSTMNIITATLGAVRAAHHNAHSPVALREQRLFEAGRDAAAQARTPADEAPRRSARSAGQYLAIYPAGSGR